MASPLLTKEQLRRIRQMRARKLILSPEDLGGMRRANAEINAIGPLRKATRRPNGLQGMLSQRDLYLTSGSP